MSRSALFLLAFIFQAGCVSARWTAEGESIKGLQPVYEDYFDRYFFGLAGPNQEVPIAEVCLDQKPIGYKKYFSFTDGFFSVISLGIYTPITMRVWCSDPKQAKGPESSKTAI